MSLYSIDRDYIYRPFRFDLFNKGKYYKVIEAKTKYGYDQEKGRVNMDEVQGVKLLLQVGLDTDVIKIKGVEETGVHEGTIIELVVRDGKVEDYEKFVSQGVFSSNQVPVKVISYDEDSVRYFDGNNDRPSLTVVGKIQETKLPQQQNSPKVNASEDSGSVNNN